MLNPKEEAQSIKRVETINLHDINNIKTCDDLIEVCKYIVDKININIADFIMANKIFNYNHRFEVSRAINEINYLKDKLLQKRKVTNDLECIIEYITSYNRDGILSDVIELTGVYYMYLGNFSNGLSMINFAKNIGGENNHNIVTNVEVLNEFIFKYNLSVDITKLDNYKDALKILQYYYDKSFRLDRGDQLLIIIYENLNKTNKSRKILESIYNVCNNALFHYEIGKSKKRNGSKVHIILGVTLIMCISVGFLYTNLLEEKTNEEYKSTSNNLSVSEQKPVKDDTKEAVKVEEKIPTKIEPKKPEVSKEKDEGNKVVTIGTLKTMMQGANNKDVINNIDKQLALLESDKKVKNSEEYKKLKKEFISKKQTFYYNLGRESFKNKNYDKATEELTLAYKERVGDYLDPHITYYLASAVNKKNSKEALKYYKEYIKKYADKDDSYIEEAIYNVSIINQSIKNIYEAKKYAEKLVDKYPNSIYNNEKIKSIIS